LTRRWTAAALATISAAVRVDFRVPTANLDCAVAVTGGAVTLAGASTVTEPTYDGDQTICVCVRPRRLARRPRGCRKQRDIHVRRSRAARERNRTGRSAIPGEPAASAHPTDC